MRFELSDSCPQELDRLALSTPQGSFYHTSPWIESLRNSLPDFEFQCLMALDGNDLVGCLPYFLTRRGPLRAAWSMPFGTYGGPLERPGTDCHGALVATYLQRLRSVGTYEIGWVDYQNRAPSSSVTESSQTHLVDLSGGFEQVWSERYHKKRRQGKRRAEREGVSVDSTTEPDDLLRFYRVYIDKMMAWGSLPQMPLELFRQLLQRGGPQVRLYVARKQGEIVGGHLNFLYKNMVMAWCVVSSASSRSDQPDSLLYTNSIRDACDEGYRWFNLGGSLQRESLIRYKKSLGGVAYDYALHRHRPAWAKALVGLRSITAASNMRPGELRTRRALG